MENIILKNGRIINEGQELQGDLWIRDGRIAKVGGVIEHPNSQEVDVSGMVVMPGIIDDQVHFREPGLTHKADIGSESLAALAGGVTSYMEMPNTKPPALTQELLQAKYEMARTSSFSNYSFYMGASNDNLDQVLRTDARGVCGVKIFMGSSTGNMLVDDREVLDKLFAQVPMLIATHCEDELTIRDNQQRFDEIYGDQLHARHHPRIRSAEGCLKSSSLAVELAKSYGTRLHILHISTAIELPLFDNTSPLAEKLITSEVCVHHLYFDAEQYETLGNRIKCNPAIKEKSNKEALWQALLDDRLDVIATDHAPHTAEEKSRPYVKAPSGLPLVQHSLTIMLDFYHRGMISLEKIVQKMCHAPAQCFQVAERGYLREGYWADVVVLDPNMPVRVDDQHLYYKCQWTPLQGREFRGEIQQVYLNGCLAFAHGQPVGGPQGMRIHFDR